MDLFCLLLIFGRFIGKMYAPGEQRQDDLSDFQRGRIYSLPFDAGSTFQAIADKLSISINSGNSYCRRAQADPEHAMGNLDCCGRKRKTSAQTDRQIKRISQTDPFKVGSAIRNELPEVEKIYKRTVQNRLLEAGLGGRKAANKPLLNEIHMKTRMNWAKDKKEWNIQDNWKHVIFFESSFDISSTGPVWVRRPVGQRYNPRYINKIRNRALAHVNVWGAFSSHGYVQSKRIGNLNSQAYIDILQERLLPNLKTFFH